MVLEEPASDGAAGRPPTLVEVIEDRFGGTARCVRIGDVDDNPVEIPFAQLVPYNAWSVPSWVARLARPAGEISPADAAIDAGIGHFLDDHLDIEAARRLLDATYEARRCPGGL